MESSKAMAGRYAFKDLRSVLIVISLLGFWARRTYPSYKVCDRPGVKAALSLPFLRLSLWSRNAIDKEGFLRTEGDQDPEVHPLRICIQCQRFVQIIHTV